MKSKNLKIRKLFGGHSKMDSTELLEEHPKFYENSEFVIELNADDFDGTRLNHSKFNGRPGLVMWYADWCPHCSNPSTIKTWEGIGDFCYPDVSVGAINCADKFYENDVLSSRVGIQGYPSITYVNGEDGEIDMDIFSDKRTSQNIVKFVCNKVKQPSQMAVCKRNLQNNF